ncbi:hypothetical protein F4055_04055 [Candidatus Poribacteria bacterium]|nr:hypothetical protein [Candidatus Poribacteria bacterium]
MPHKCQIELKKKWVCDHLSDVTNEKTAWVLLQEPGFIGFGVVEANEIWLPPYEHKSSKWEPDWELVSDLRLFGEKGEWHIWRDWDGKHYARLLKLESIAEDHTLTEFHALWGSEVEPAKPPWVKLVEERGTEIWLPLAHVKKKHLPLRLKLKQIIDYDPKTHLAGITDAAIVGLTRESKEVIFPPSSVSSS